MSRTIVQSANENADMSCDTSQPIARSSLCALENERNRRGQTRPAFRFVFEVGPAGGSEPIEFRLPAGLRLCPVRGEQLLVFQPMQRGVERTLLDLESFTRDLLDLLGDGVPVDRPVRNDPENQKIERALRELGFGCGLHTCSFYI